MDRIIALRTQKIDRAWFYNFLEKKSSNLKSEGERLIISFSQRLKREIRVIQQFQIFISNSIFK